MKGTFLYDSHFRLMYNTQITVVFFCGSEYLHMQYYASRAPSIICVSQYSLIGPYHPFVKKRTLQKSIVG